MLNIRKGVRLHRAQVSLNITDLKEVSAFIFSLAISCFKHVNNGLFQAFASGTFVKKFINKPFSFTNEGNQDLNFLRTYMCR